MSAVDEAVARLIRTEADETAKYAVRWLKELGASQQAIEQVRDLYTDLFRLRMAVTAGERR